MECWKVENGTAKQLDNTLKSPMSAALHKANGSLQLVVSLYGVNVCTTKCLTGELVYSNDLIFFFFKLPACLAYG